MKNLFYVNGGGLGHLSRISAFIFTLKIKISESIILTSSDFASLLFPTSSIKQIPNSFSKDIKKLTSFIQSTINNNNFENIYIDTFPLGILGELKFIDFQDIRLIYISRRLKWKSYAPILDNNTFKYHLTYIIEQSSKEQFNFIISNSEKQISLALNYQKNKPSEDILVLFPSDKETWLIVHSTPIEEVYALLEHAKDIAKAEEKNPLFVIISQHKLKATSKIIQLNYFPAYNLFPYVDKVFSACGFNIMQQTKNFRKKHISIPFPRKFDDQFWRKNSE